MESGWGGGGSGGGDGPLSNFQADITGATKVLLHSARFWAFISLSLYLRVIIRSMQRLFHD